MEPLIGEIKLFAGDFAPRGWLFCDGTLLNMDRYHLLFSVIQNYYGGDGMETFALPDLRGRVAVHVGHGASPAGKTYRLGEQAGANTIKLVPQQLPPHSHRVNVFSSEAQETSPADACISATVTDQTSGAGVLLYTKPADAKTPDAKLHDSTISGGGDSQPVSIIQPSLGLNYIIAWEGIFPSRP